MMSVPVTPGNTYNIYVGVGGIPEENKDGYDGKPTLFVYSTNTIFKAIGGGGGKTCSIFNYTGAISALVYGGIPGKNYVTVTNNNCLGLPEGQALMHVWGAAPFSIYNAFSVPLYGGGFGGMGFASNTTNYPFSDATKGSEYPCGCTATNYAGDSGVVGSKAGSYYGGGAGGGGAASAFGDGGYGGDGGNGGTTYGLNGGAGGSATSTAYGAGGGGAGAGGNGLLAGGNSALGGSGGSGVLFLTWQE
jgi:hypothetical protein